MTKDEREEDDAEVNFAGGASTGQVKLEQHCEDRTSIEITSGPNDPCGRGGRGARSPPPPR